MSHHYSGPDFGFPHGDARLDFTDLYAFPLTGEPYGCPFRRRLRARAGALGWVYAEGSKACGANTAAGHVVL